MTEINNFSEWEELLLGDLCIIKGGKRLPKGEQLISQKNSHPYIRVTDINGSKIKKSTLQYVPDSVFPSISNYIVNSGDIILSIVGTVGLIAKIDDELEQASLTENCVKLTNFSKNVDKNFIFYFLISKRGKEEISSKIVGAVQSKLPIYNIQKIKISLPPISEQKAISKLLSSIDGKRDLLCQQNESLESIAQAIFKQWFIDFEFPNKKNQPYKSSGGKMVKSELGEIPENWEASNYGKLAEVITGKGLKPELLSDNGSYVLLGANGEIGRTEEYLFDDDLILTGRVGTLGTVYISRGKVWISDNVLVSKIKKIENFYFTYFYLKQVNFGSLNRGSTQPLITQTDLKNVNIVMPSDEILKEWHEHVSKIFWKISNNKQQINNLSKLMNVIAPALMTGEVKVNF